MSLCRLRRLGVPNGGDPYPHIDMQILTVLISDIKRDTKQRRTTDPIDRMEFKNILTAVFQSIYGLCYLKFDI